MVSSSWLWSAIFLSCYRQTNGWLCPSSRETSPIGWGVRVVDSCPTTESSMRYYQIMKAIGEYETMLAVNDYLDRSQGHTNIRCPQSSLETVEWEYTTCLKRIACRVKCVATSEPEFCAGFSTFYHRCNTILARCFSLGLMNHIRRTQIASLHGAMDDSEFCGLRIPEQRESTNTEDRRSFHTSDLGDLQLVEFVK